MAEKQEQQDPSSAARIRDNQRRSRARHREYVGELKAKIREYEVQGAQATLEMRQAARKVALENSRLRALLASRGVTNKDVDQYLASFDDQAFGVSPTIALAPPTHERDLLSLASESLRQDADGGTLCESQTVNTARSIESGVVGFQPEPDVHGSRERLPESGNCHFTNASISALDTLAVVADATIRQACCGSTTQRSPADGRDTHGHGAGPSLYDGPMSASASPGPKTPKATASPLEMSCIAAANIIANIYRDGNEELARQALGCSGTEECLVKNTMVFQLLDTPDAV